jgi:hypothetical protein
MFVSKYAKLTTVFRCEENASRFFYYRTMNWSAFISKFYEGRSLMSFPVVLIKFLASDYEGDMPEGVVLTPESSNLELNIDGTPVYVKTDSNKISGTFLNTEFRLPL